MKPVITATVIGTVLQLGMVLTGHTNPSIAQMFAVGGMSISLIAGLIYAVMAKPPAKGEAAMNGAIAGGVCAIIGIGVSCALGDVTPFILFAGTLSSAVTGAIGGFVGQLMFGGRAWSAGAAA